MTIYIYGDCVHNNVPCLISEVSLFAAPGFWLFPVSLSFGDIYLFLSLHISFSSVWSISLNKRKKYQKGKECEKLEEYKWKIIMK